MPPKRKASEPTGDEPSRKKPAALSVLHKYQTSYQRSPERLPPSDLRIMFDELYELKWNALESRTLYTTAFHLQYVEAQIKLLDCISQRREKIKEWWAKNVNIETHKESLWRREMEFKPAIVSFKALRERLQVNKSASIYKAARIMVLMLQNGYITMVARRNPFGGGFEEEYVEGFAELVEETVTEEITVKTTEGR